MMRKSARFGPVSRNPHRGPETLLPACLSLILFAADRTAASIPLAATPSWSSTSNDYSTGGQFGDIDTNGWLDFCISNGNDMAMDQNAVYFNVSGNLENTASWRSSDNGNFGHLYLGDVDNDGLLDMATAYLGPAGDRRARIYRNIGGTLGRAPWWKSKDSTTHFDICLGDVNSDGWLDVALSAGDAYSSLREPHKIYFNRQGVVDTLPGWRSANLVQSDAVRLADLDNDGRLDLIADGKGYLYVYYQRGDSLEQSPSWIDTTGNSTMGLRLALADYDRDGWLDLATVCNGQVGSPNSIRVYRNNRGILAKPPAYVLQRRNRYSSCVAWGDPNGDGWPDLAASGWWEPVVVYENRSGLLDTIPAWSWSHGSALVGEAVLWGDLRNRHVSGFEELADGDGRRKLFYLGNAPIQDLGSIEVDGTPVPRSGYCVDPLAGYVSLQTAPPVGTGNVRLRYTFSRHPDLGLTNWERSDHNYVFLNLTPTAISEPGPHTRDDRPGLRALPGASGVLLIARVPARSRATLNVYSPDGRLSARLGRLAPGTHRVRWDFPDRLTPGLYFAKLICYDGFGSCCRIILCR